MSDFEDIQRLIRLKRHERPSEDFVEQFVSRFQDRQRSEMLRNSARGLLWERVTTYFDGMINPKWAWAGATAVAIFGLGFVMRPMASNGTGTQLVANHAQAQPTLTIDAREVQTAAYRPNQTSSPLSLDVGRNFISRNYGGGLGDEPLLSGSPGQLYSGSGFKFDLESDSRR
jgi:hypothetical protein